METQNEIKANEIVRATSFLPNLTEYEAMMHCALEAMEWKDEQFKEQRKIIRDHWQAWAEEQINKTIDKVCEWIEEQSYGGWIKEPTDEFIESLKQSMKGE